MNSATIFNTAISTRNVGDEIIMEAVRNEVSSILLDYQIFNVPTHNCLSMGSWKCLRESSLAVVGGTNILSSNMPFYQQWKIYPHDLIFSPPIVLLGVGWWQYQNSPNFYTKWLLRKILKNKYIHSARDQYTVEMLKKIGVCNVINTGCPTMWGLNPSHCLEIPEKRSESVVYTLTDYNRCPRSDGATVKILRENYEKVYIWLQGSKDYAYYQSLRLEGYIDGLIPPQLKSYDNVLEEEDVEYIGTRLHAGIRALQKGKRSLILAVDNRAKEKHKDYNIHVLDREDVGSITDHIYRSRNTVLSVDFDAINDWRNQFYL